MTATQTQLRRGTAAQVAAMTPVEGEVVVNTTDERIHVGDGTAAGGYGCPNLRDIQQQKALVATVGGTANAITLTHSPVVGSYVTGLRSIFKPTSDSTSAVTLNWDGLGTKDAKYALDNVLTAFSSTTILKSGLYYEAIYDGTQCQILGIGRTTPPSSVVTGTTVQTTSDPVTITVDFTTYSSYRIIYNGVTANNLGIEASSDGGSGYTAFTIKGHRITTTTVTSETAIGSCTTGNLVFDICQPVTGGEVHVRMNGVTNTSTVTSMNMEGKSGLSAACNRIKFTASGGSISAGYYTLIPTSAR